MQVRRSEHNPIIRPEDAQPSRDDMEVTGTFNAAATRIGDQTILLVRVAEKPICLDPAKVCGVYYDCDNDRVVCRWFSREDPEVDCSDPRMIFTPDGPFLTSLSHFRIARSADGEVFEVDDKPAITAAEPDESFGLEDPRITRINNEYYISYVGVSEVGVVTKLISTADFTSFSRKGVIFCPDNKDVVIFPEKIQGRYWAIHRPVTCLFNKYEMWIAESDNLLYWGRHRHILSPGAHSWDSCKLGAGAVPFRAEQGWLEVYHGVDDQGRYSLGAVLLDAHKPWKVLAASSQAILQPQADYEKRGFYPGVVFTCGVVADGEELRIYYGSADSCQCLATVRLSELMENLETI